MFPVRLFVSTGDAVAQPHSRNGETVAVSLTPEGVGACDGSGDEGEPGNGPGGVLLRGRLRHSVLPLVAVCPDYRSPRQANGGDMGKCFEAGRWPA